MDHIVFRAVEFAARAHSGQYRKGTRIPYVLHPLRVAQILIEIEAPPIVVAAAILHDTVEDTAATIVEIESEFGLEVSELVVAASEPDRSAPWEERKRHTIDTLAQVPEDALLIVCADKLDNLRSMHRGEQRHGPEFWDRFHRPKERQGWYFRNVAAALEARAQSEPLLSLVQNLSREVERVFARRARDS